MTFVERLFLLVVCIPMLHPGSAGLLRKQDEAPPYFSDMMNHDGTVIPEDCGTKVMNGTFLGNRQRNFYGNDAPSELKLIWRFPLGTGTSRIGRKLHSWSGAGWTGQPLLVLEDSIPCIIQGSFDHNLRKINALSGTEIWRYSFGDAIKGTGTIWYNRHARNVDEKYIILQGSRQGLNSSFTDPVIPSFRAISLLSGIELWRMNSKRTRCFSRDVDGSALVFNDTAYIGLENGIFTVFDPSPDSACKTNDTYYPRIFQETWLYNNKDRAAHGPDLVTESSPALTGSHLYVTSGSGHVFGYNLKTKSIDWDFFTGSDINGSAVVTSDSCLLIPIEKQYISGQGGVLKLDPRKAPDEAVVWYFPTNDAEYAMWKGGIIGSAGVNDHYRKNESDPSLAAFIATDGNLYVVDHRSVETGKKATGFDGITGFPTPRLVFSYRTGPSISTPLIVDNKIIAASCLGVFLFEFTPEMEFTLLDHLPTGNIESTPIVYKNRLFVASRDGWLYCAGDDSIAKPVPVVAQTINTRRIAPSGIPKSDSRVERNFIPATGARPAENIVGNVSPAVQKSTADKGYYLIAGSFVEKTNAERLLAKMVTSGYPSRIITTSSGWNMVSINGFGSRNEALAEQRKLPPQLGNTWILAY